uniref:RRM domain-containing protein n=1 Tax=Steinernema glaseri TaxID=37863 RepID=A0A1I8A3U2_9BILA
MESEIVQIRRVCEDSRFTPYMKPHRDRVEADAKSIYVGNVEYKSTENDLRAHFGGCGTIERISIITDHFSGHPKGYAYVQFSVKEEQQKALALSGSELNGRAITVAPKRTNFRNMGLMRGRSRPMLAKYVFYKPKKMDRMGRM